MAFREYPKQILYIVGNDACERFSYYGMRSILVAYMMDRLLFSQHTSEAIYHYFVSASYFLTLLGGFLADRYLGKYKTIIYLSLVYCLGHGVMAMGETPTYLYLGLALIAIGAGGFKPCVSTHVGDQFNVTNKHLLEKVFEIFYFATNFGAVFAPIVIPWILKSHGPSLAFGVPGILMVIATFIFWMGRHYYVYVPPSGPGNGPQFVSVVWSALTQGWEKTKAKFPAEKIEGARAVIDVSKVFLLISAFWALYDQQGSTWVNQAEKMDRELFGIVIERSQIQAMSPFLILVLLPIFSKVIYPGLRKLGLALTPIQRMKIGMWITALCFLSVAIIEQALPSKPSVAWLMVPAFLITAAEIMVSITGLEFAYTQAPRAMKSTIMSLFFLTISLGNLFTGVLKSLNLFSGVQEILFYTGMMAVVAAIFMWVASHYKVRNYVEPRS